MNIVIHSRRSIEEAVPSLQSGPPLVEAECERVLSKQTKSLDPFAFSAGVDLNIRMMAALLPSAADAIRRMDLPALLASLGTTPKGGG